MCADDFGSALSALKFLKTPASIFKLASSVSGLKLKASKCVLIVSVCGLSEFAKQAIRNLICHSIPEFADFKISAAGKYLRWFLGCEGDVLSFRSPITKFKERIEEVVAGKAPAPVALCRCNQRAVSVLSYVGQFSECPATYDLPALDQQAVHSLLRIPPNSLTRALTHSLSVFTVVEPTPLEAYIAACRFRSAYSERK